MPVMDEFKEEREALKHGTPKEKLSYFVYYYKWHVIVAVCAIIAVAVLANQLLTRKDTALYIALINGVDITSEEPEGNSFPEYAGVDTEKSSVIYDTSMLIDFTSMQQISITSAQKFVVYLSAAEMDIVISGENIIQKYAHNGTFYDLTKFLSAEQLEKYSPYFYYIDYAVMEQINAAQSAYDYDFVPEYPDPTKPEDMKQPVPIGIYVDGCPALTDRFIFSNSESGIILSVIANTARPEITSRYIDYLMKDVVR